jgi:HSP20 family protein
MSSMMPWTGLTSFKQEMDRLLDRFLEPRGLEVEAFGEWAPKLDVSETKDAIMVKAELPGLEAKDIELAIHDQTLSLKGEKSQEKETKEERYHRVERAYGAFARSVRLPSAVDAAKVTATFKSGVLTVTLPKVPGARGTTIPVKAA